MESNVALSKWSSLAEKTGFTEVQLDLIQKSIAKNASPEELELFLYRCKELKLNPLMPGQIHFIKFKNRKTGEWSPGTTVIGIDGFRSRANSTGKLNGIKRGVIRNPKGECIGGWADVYRRDWEHSAHIEVSLKEYANPYKDMWRDMPESMIQKVAEVAALRMAFPDELSGVYSPDEMDQAEKGVREIPSTPVTPPTLPPTTDVRPATPPALPPPSPERRPTPKQVERLWTIAAKAKISPEQVHEFIFKEFQKKSVTELSIAEYQDTCDELLHEIELASKQQGAHETIPPRVTQEDDASAYGEMPPWMQT